MGLPLKHLSLAEYLDWENRQPEKHELFRGEIFAMVGARRVHGLVAGNVFSALKRQLRGGPCQAFMESLKVQVAENTVLYPDVFVTCDAADLQTDYLFRAPSLVVEILSDSTRNYDRGLKFALYRRLESLREYLLIDPDTRLVELFRRGPDGLFVLHDHSDSKEFELKSISCRLSMEEIFESLPPNSPV